MNLPIESTKELGTLVRRVRKAQRIRQDDLAGMVSASHVFLIELERGKSTVQFGKVLDVLRELGIRLIADVPDTVAPLSSATLTTKRKVKRLD